MTHKRAVPDYLFGTFVDLLGDGRGGPIKLPIVTAPGPVEASNLDLVADLIKAAWGEMKRSRLGSHSERAKFLARLARELLIAGQTGRSDAIALKRLALKSLARA
jgi:hypothetical protein